MSPRTERNAARPPTSSKPLTCLEDLLESESSGDSDFDPEPLPGSVQTRDLAYPELQNMRFRKETTAPKRTVALKSVKENGFKSKDSAEKATVKKIGLYNGGIKKAINTTREKQNPTKQGTKKDGKGVTGAKMSHADSNGLQKHVLPTRPSFDKRHYDTSLKGDNFRRR